MSSVLTKTAWTIALAHILRDDHTEVLGVKLRFGMVRERPSYAGNTLVRKTLQIQFVNEYDI